MNPPPRDVTPLRKEKRLHLLLFVATLITTTWAGYLMGGTLPLAFSFSAAIMFILLVHEMGHYTASRLHKVPATLPYFIPAPPPFIAGTFGAVIRMKGAIWDRRALLDIGCAGPIAGFIIAVPIVIIGFALSKPVPFVQDEVTFFLGDSLLTLLVQKLVIGGLPEGTQLFLHPVGFAGWLGLFITSLNLLPVGQLDGGHIMMALSPRHSRVIARGVHIILFPLGYFYWPGWLVWAVFLIFLGVRHPPVLLPHIALDDKRRRVGFAAIVIFFLTFVPVPFQII